MDRYIISSGGEEYGPFAHAAARAKAWDILRRTGEEVWVYRLWDKSLVALAYGGSLLIAQQYGKEGGSLPQAEWFNFWR